MNRLVIIGNGFDLAHGLKTSYADFINWYWEQRLNALLTEHAPISEDCLCRLEIKNTKDCASWSNFFHLHSLRDLMTGEWKYPLTEIVSAIKENTDDFSVTYSKFFETILQSIETRGWVDIENEYYDLLETYSLKQYDEGKIRQLNEQLQFLQELLTNYLKTVNEQDIPVNVIVEKKIYEPIEYRDLSVEYKKEFNEYIDWCNKQDECFWENKLSNFKHKTSTISGDIFDVQQYRKKAMGIGRYPDAYMLPESIMLLDFNYTKTVREYLKDSNVFSHIQIHGCLEKPETMIFGYGDEFEDKYKKLQNLNNNDCLTNIKTIRYLESDNYRKALSFIESGPFQVCIMGHSCGNSDRTLLNTIFEHKKCISIKPYFYKRADGTDSYIELIQNISRNFKDMKLMRDRVVNRNFTKALTQQ